MRDQRFRSIHCMAQARLDKSPRRGAKQKRIKTLLHEDDDLICQIPRGHIVEIVRCCFVGVRFHFHLIQPFASPTSTALFSEAYRAKQCSFHTRVLLVIAVSLLPDPTLRKVGGSHCSHIVRGESRPVIELESQARSTFLLLFHIALRFWPAGQEREQN